MPRWPLLLLCGCAGSHLLRVENDVLRARNASLESRVAELELRAPDPRDYAREVDLSVVHEFLGRAGYDNTLVTTGAGHVELDWHGKNANFGVTIRYFPNANVVFLATDDYLDLKDATSTESVVLLLVQLAALNYDLLVGKFQLNPESGEILFSMELHVEDGLGYATLAGAFRDLCEMADAKKPDLDQAIAGLGL